MNGPTSVSGSDEDLSAIRPGVSDRVGGSALMLAGFFTVLLGIQTYVVVRLVAWTVLVVVTMFVVGLCSLYFGFKVTRRRGWAAVAGTASGGLTAMLGVVWLVFSLFNGLLSLLALGVVPLAAAAAGLSATRIAAGRRADAARARLEEAGLEAGY